MIKVIKITNFCSIGATQELSFAITTKDVLDHSAATISPTLNVNLVNCLIGHNASGKTSILKAISFVFWLIVHSYTSMKPNTTIPVRAHELHKEELTKIEMEFLNDGNSYSYIVELNQQAIYREYLGRHVLRGYTRVFEYRRTEEDWDFKASKLTINSSDLKRFKERRNVSVLGSLIETGYLPEFNFLYGIDTNVTNIGHFIRHPMQEFLDVSKFLHSDTSLKMEALNFVEMIDIGISDFEFSEGMIIKDKMTDGENKQLIECIHKSENVEFALPLIEESSGTRHSLLMLTLIMPILKAGGIIVLDEFETGLHPYVAKKIISFFEQPETNPRSAQLIFSTHQHLFLNDRTKTQIFIAEKDPNNFETEVYRLDEIEGVRNYENFFDKYISGSYGGIGNIKWTNT